LRSEQAIMATELRVDRLLSIAAGELSGVSGGEARLEAELLLALALGVGRAGLLARLREPVSPEQQAAFAGLLARRRAGEPVAYLRGQQAFYRRDYLVNRHVLIPRPETETLVEAALAFARTHPGTWQIADIGTGCGCIAITLAAELPQATVIALDRSEAALRVAAENARRHQVAHQVRLVCGDLLTALAGRFHLVTANLPYWPEERWAELPVSIREYEPRSAIDGGPAGLTWITACLRQLPNHLQPPAAVLLEIDEGQAAAVSALARERLPGAALAVIADALGLPRVVQLLID